MKYTSASHGEEQGLVSQDSLVKQEGAVTSDGEDVPELRESIRHPRSYGQALCWFDYAPKGLHV